MQHAGALLRAGEQINIRHVYGETQAYPFSGLKKCANKGAALKRWMPRDALHETMEATIRGHQGCARSVQHDLLLSAALHKLWTEPVTGYIF